MRSEKRHIAIIKEPKHKTVSDIKSAPVQLDCKTDGTCHDRNVVPGVFAIRAQYDQARRQRVRANVAAIRHLKPNY